MFSALMASLPMILRKNSTAKVIKTVRNDAALAPHGYETFSKLLYLFILAFYIVQQLNIVQHLYIVQQLYI